ncbi:MAG: glycosyltransferase, partial [Proteobacteria bacterium]|nr:glycosyltransferase [Pseudomonadota bacterium]
MSFELKPVRPARPAKVDLSVVLPIYDEEESLHELLDNLFRILDGLDRSYEIWCVNDGSRDRSSAILHEIAKQRHELCVLDFRRNFGQTAALMAGFDHSRGDVIVTL